MSGHMYNGTIVYNDNSIKRQLLLIIKQDAICTVPHQTFPVKRQLSPTHFSCSVYPSVGAGVSTVPSGWKVMGSMARYSVGSSLRWM